MLLLNDNLKKNKLKWVSNVLTTLDEPGKSMGGVWGGQLCMH